jgi:hypothetical protein
MHVSSQSDNHVSALGLESGVWLVTCRSQLETRAAVDELQDTCLAALDQGARRLVVDVSDLTSVSLDGLRLLVVLADILLAQGSRLLLACRDGARGSYHLLAVEGDTRAALSRIVDERSRGLLSSESAAEGVRRV